MVCEFIRKYTNLYEWIPKDTNLYQTIRPYMKKYGRIFDVDFSHVVMGFDSFCFFRRTAGMSPLSTFGASRQRTATASAVASLFDGGRGQYFTDLVCAGGIVWYTLVSFGIARAFLYELCFALIVCFAFWYCSLVIEGLRQQSAC